MVSKVFVEVTFIVHAGNETLKFFVVDVDVFVTLLLEVKNPFRPPTKHGANKIRLLALVFLGQKRG